MNKSIRLFPILISAGALLVASAVSLLGQAAVSDSSSPAPSPTTQTTNRPDEGPLSSPAPQLPSVQQLDEMFKQTPLGKAADDARLHAQWRELRNRTANDPLLETARRHAEAARTDLEKRERLRAYYNSYFGLMRGEADSQELKDFIEERRTEQIALLAQDRVRPGSTPAGPAAPAASPGVSKHKHKKHGAREEIRPALPSPEPSQ
ncbi:MAG: hypothetical protein DLM52_05630 [Chthoniobacterales bacterium]|nr:MAG: hypothetical protein DLM52_05630 [Chthoniobacterales bacterium]